MRWTEKKAKNPVFSTNVAQVALAVQVDFQHTLFGYTHLRIPLFHGPHSESTWTTWTTSVSSTYFLAKVVQGTWTGLVPHGPDTP